MYFECRASTEKMPRDDLDVSNGTFVDEDAFIRPATSDYASQTHFSVHLRSRWLKVWLTGLILCIHTSESVFLPLKEADAKLQSSDPNISLSAALDASDIHPTLENHPEEKYSAWAEFRLSDGGPKLQAVRKLHRKCRYPYRENYCMHGGKCEWIPELKQPRCTCKNGWKGERCGTYQFGFDANNPTREKKLVIGLVVSCFGVLGIVLVGCICWRRIKYLRKHRNTGENTAMMMPEKAS